MGLEVERKFLPADESWRQAVDGLPGLRIRQGYLSGRKEAVVRVRVADDQAYLTVKGATQGSADGTEIQAEIRAEFEYPIPVTDARFMLDTLVESPPLEKIRYRLPMHGMVWEIDEFLGRHAGLVILEIELEHENQEFFRPSWVGREVSRDPRYSNAVLAGGTKHPESWRPS